MITIRPIGRGCMELIPKKRSDAHDKQFLQLVARVSYDLARPVGMGRLQPYETPTDKVKFSEYIKLKKLKRYDELDPVVLHMDYVNGRQCKTVIMRDAEGRFIFDAALFGRDRDLKQFLDRLGEEYGKLEEPIGAFRRFFGGKKRPKRLRSKPDAIARK
ncbi:MAG: hypothetical protein V1881_04100 [Candidatus Micrarchaeota archaeon]